MSVSVRRAIIQILDDTMNAGKSRARWTPQIGWHSECEHKELMHKYETTQTETGLG